MLVRLAMLTALGFYAKHLFYKKAPVTTRKLESSLYQAHIDRAQNTLMRDDRSTPSSSISKQLSQMWFHQKAVFDHEAAEHPGVRLVAHAIL